MLAGCSAYAATRTQLEQAPTVGEIRAALKRLGIDPGDLTRDRFTPYIIPSPNMEPTLSCAAASLGCTGRSSDRVLARRAVNSSGEPRRGDIFAFKTPISAAQYCAAAGTFVNRLIGLPGEKIEVRLVQGDGYVFINGRKLKEPYITRNRRQLRAGYGPTTIPAGKYFMMGDNREASCDSREFGAVPRKNLEAKVIAIYWPPERVRRL